MRKLYVWYVMGILIGLVLVGVYQVRADIQSQIIPTAVSPQIRPTPCCAEPVFDKPALTRYIGTDREIIAAIIETLMQHGIDISRIEAVLEPERLPPVDVSEIIR